MTGEIPPPPDSNDEAFTVPSVIEMSSQRLAAVVDFIDAGIMPGRLANRRNGYTNLLLDNIDTQGALSPLRNAMADTAAVGTSLVTMGAERGALPAYGSMSAVRHYALIDSRYRVLSAILQINSGLREYAATTVGSAAAANPYHALASTLLQSIPEQLNNLYATDSYSSECIILEGQLIKLFGVVAASGDYQLMDSVEQSLIRIMTQDLHSRGSSDRLNIDRLSYVFRNTPASFDESSWTAILQEIDRLLPNDPGQRKSILRFITANEYILAVANNISSKNLRSRPGGAATVKSAWQGAILDLNYPSVQRMYDMFESGEEPPYISEWEFLSGPDATDRITAKITGKIAAQSHRVTGRDAKHIHETHFRKNWDLALKLLAKEWQQQGHGSYRYAHGEIINRPLVREADADDQLFIDEYAALILLDPHGEVVAVVADSPRKGIHASFLWRRDVSRYDWEIVLSSKTKTQATQRGARRVLHTRSRDPNIGEATHMKDRFLDLVLRPPDRFLTPYQFAQAAGSVLLARSVEPNAD